VGGAAQWRPRLTANQIRFIALIRGIPLKITSVSSYDGDNTALNQAELKPNKCRGGL